MDLIEQIRLTLEQAARDRHKIAMLHAQVLIHAAELEEMGADEFCRLLNLQATFATEFQQMRAAARMLAQLGYAVTRTT